MTYAGNGTLVQQSRADGFRHEYSPRHIYGTDAVDFQERVNFPRMRDYRLGRLKWAMKIKQGELFIM